MTTDDTRPLRLDYPETQDAYDDLAARHAALVAAAQHALDYTQPDGIECCQCCGQFDDEGHSEDCFVPALRAALDGEPFTHPRIGTQEGT